MKLTPENMYKLLFHRARFATISDACDFFAWYGENYFTIIPKNQDILFFEPLTQIFVRENQITYNDGVTRVRYYSEVNDTNFIANAMPMYLLKCWAVRLANDYRYRYYAFYSFAEEIYQKSISSIFNTKSLPTNSEGLLDFEETELGESLAGMSVQLLGGWTYNEEKHSCRTLHYLIKIVNGGDLNNAQFVWTKLPYSVSTTYYKPDAQSYYSESLPFYQSGTTTIKPYATYRDYYRWNNYVFFTPLSEGIWAESRRKDPTIKDVYIFLVVRPDKRGIEVFETPFEFEPEKIFSYTSDFDIKQATWFNGRIILLEDSDPYALHVLDLDGTVTQIAQTSISQGSTVMLVSHPDQDVCYLFGESEQWIIKSDLTTETTTFDFTDLISWDHIQFDIDGYVWFDGSKRDKNLLTEVLNVPNARCNYTYIAVDNGDETYSAYHLDGVTEIRNIAEEAKSQLFWTGVAYRYPQKVLYPYNATDLQLFTENGDLTSPNWYGWNGTQWVPYDGNNPRTIDSTTIDIEDGVRLSFDFSSGGFVQDEYLYFTVTEGLIKDGLSEIEVKKVYDLRFWEYHYIDITLTLENLIDNGDGTYSYYVPEYDNANFWELDTFLLEATFDDPEQVGAGVDAEIITGGTPTSGQVLVETKTEENKYFEFDCIPSEDRTYQYPSKTGTGKLTFAQEDIGRTFQMHYYVVIDTTCPF